MYVSFVVPATWKTQNGIQLLDVPDTDKEFNDALKEFFDTIGVTASIVRLQRIENHTIYIGHKSFLDAMTGKYPRKDKIVSKTLFHGSKESSVTKILNQGFNRNFAADANGKCRTCLLPCIKMQSI